MSAVTAAELLDALEAAGVALALDEAGELVLRAPRGVLTPDIRAAIQERRDAIVMLVQERRRGAFDATAAPRWRAAWERRRRMPHAALERAIDMADPAAFEREISIYEATAPRAIGGEAA